MKLLLLANNRVGWQIARHLRDQHAEIVGLVLHPPHRQKHGEEIRAAAGVPSAALFDASRLRLQPEAAAVPLAAQIDDRAYAHQRHLADLPGRRLRRSPDPFTDPMSIGVENSKNPMVDEQHIHIIDGGTGPRRGATRDCVSDGDGAPSKGASLLFGDLGQAILVIVVPA